MQVRINEKEAYIEYFLMSNLRYFDDISCMCENFELFFFKYLLSVAIPWKLNTIFTVTFPFKL